QDGEPRAALTAVLTSKALEVARNGFAGATAGAVSRVLTAPLDVAKIRFQLDHGATRRYDSTLWAAMRSIYGEEGLVTLWRGNLPAMFLWSAYTAVQFSAYEQLRATDFLRSRQHDSSSGSGGGRHRGSICPSSSPPHERRGAGRVGEVGGGWRTGGREGENQYQALRRQQDGRGRGLPPALANFAYGAMAAFTATLVTYPLDITRTALAFQGVPKRYNSMSEFLRRTARESGVRGLFRGATPTLAMITPQMGVSFAVWEALKGGAPPPAFSGSGSGASPAVTLSWQLGAGMVAGMVGKLVVFPLDTVKKRVQTAVRTRIREEEEEVGRGLF
ncbi:unnamed protein product, partial [Ectocarpus sp. 6 AP-2014]